MATHSSILAWEIPWTEDTGGYSRWGRRESDTAEQLSRDSSRGAKKPTSNRWAWSGGLPRAKQRYFSVMLLPRRQDSQRWAITCNLSAQAASL